MSWWEIIIFCFILFVGIIMVGSHVKIKESTIYKALNLNLKDTLFDQHSYDELKKVFDNVWEHPEIYIFDVTGDCIMMRDLSRIINDSTAENVQEHIKEYINNKIKEEKNKDAEGC